VGDERKKMRMGMGMTNSSASQIYMYCMDGMNE
jgi:hypothetical protein